MDIATLASVISTIGFPIVAFIMCGWFCKYILDMTREENKQLSKAIQANTTATMELKQVVSMLLIENKDGGGKYEKC